MLHTRPGILVAAVMLISVSGTASADTYPFIGESRLSLVSMPTSIHATLGESAVAYSTDHDVLAHARIEQTLNDRIDRRFTVLISMWNPERRELLQPTITLLDANVYDDAPPAPGDEGLFYDLPAASSLHAAYDPIAGRFLVLWKNALINTATPSKPPSNAQKAGHAYFYSIVTRDEEGQWAASPVKKLTGAQATGPMIHRPIFFIEDSVYLFGSGGPLAVEFFELTRKEDAYDLESSRNISLEFNTALPGIPYGLHDVDIVYDTVENRFILAGTQTEEVVPFTDDDTSSFEYRSVIVSRAFNPTNGTLTGFTQLSPSNDSVRAETFATNQSRQQAFGLSDVALSWTAHSSDMDTGHLRLHYLDRGASNELGLVARRIATNPNPNFARFLENFDNRSIIGGYPLFKPSAHRDTQTGLFTVIWGESKLFANGSDLESRPTRHAPAMEASLPVNLNQGRGAVTSAVHTPKVSWVHVWGRGGAELLPMSWHWADIELSAATIGGRPILNKNDEFSVEVIVKHGTPEHSLVQQAAGPVRIRFEQTEGLEFISVDGNVTGADPFEGFMVNSLSPNETAVFEVRFKNAREQGTATITVPIVAEILGGHDPDNTNNVAEIVYELTDSASGDGNEGDGSGEDNSTDDGNNPENGDNTGGGSNPGSGGGNDTENASGKSGGGAFAWMLLLGAFPFFRRRR